MSIQVPSTLATDDRVALSAEAPQVPEGITSPEWGQLRRQIEAAQDAVRWERSGAGTDEGTDAGSWQAANRAHGLVTSFDEHGIQMRPNGSDDTVSWELSLRLLEYGYEGAMVSARAADPQGYGRRVRYDRGDLKEWFVNDSRGLEQGWTLVQRPEPPAAAGGSQPDESPLRLRLQVGGSLRPHSIDSSAVALVDADGEAMLRYGGLVAWDATGEPVAARMTAGASEIWIEVEDAEASYPLTVDPFFQQAQLQASDREDDDDFGDAVAISGDTAIVGAPEEDTGGGGAGAAYLFDRHQGGTNLWGQVAKIQASDREAGDDFGESVAISGDTAIIGADDEDTGGNGAGSAYLFRRNTGGANNWGQVAKIQASDIEAGDDFGEAVAISGNTAVVGSKFEDTGGSDAGAAYVFDRNQGGANNWGQVRKIQASDKQTDDEFGESVGISGDTVVVGADHIAVRKGAAYVFARTKGGANNWGQVAKLQASDGVDGDDFGESVGIDGDLVIVGAEDKAAQVGAAYVFGRNWKGTNAWGQVDKLLASDGVAGDEFGMSVSISGATVIVGAPDNDTGGLSAGAAYVSVFLQAPVAADDNYTTSQDTPLVVPASTGVLSNDTDPDGDALTAILETGPTNGTLALSSDGSFTYTPTRGS